MPQLGFQSIEKGEVSVKGRNLENDGVVIVVGIVGEIKGNVVYCLELECAKKIASTMMMGMPVIEFDDMAQSALSELSNMLTANAATSFAEMGISLDISTPTLLYGEKISVKMNSDKVLCIELIADTIPIHVNISFD